MAGDVILPHLNPTIKLQRKAWITKRVELEAGVKPGAVAKVLGVETAEHLEEEVVADLNERPELPRLELLSLTTRDPSCEAWEVPSSPMLGTEYATSPRLVTCAHWTLLTAAFKTYCTTVRYCLTVAATLPGSVCNDLRGDD